MTDRYPVVSETFVVNEVEELRRQGHEVRVEAATAPDPTGASLPAGSCLPR